MEFSTILPVFTANRLVTTLKRDWLNYKAIEVDGTWEFHDTISSTVIYLDVDEIHLCVRANDEDLDRALTIIRGIGNQIQQLERVRIHRENR